MFKFSWSILIVLLLLQMKVLGQSLVTNVPQLDFGMVLDTEPQSLPLTITNQSNEYINVLDIQFFDTFKDPAFFSNTMSFALEPNETKTIEITFSPIHNVAHNTEMFIVTQHRGAFAVDLIGQGRYSNEYYFATENLSGSDLYNSLNQIISSSTVSLNYNSARDEMFMEIDNERVNGQDADVNTIEGVYTGELITEYNSRGDAQNEGFNTEHTWPQSKGAGSTPMKSDLFHIFPTNGNANTRRGSRKLGPVSDPVWEEGGSKQGPSGSDLFEPRDEQKGQAARALFYFATRYKNQSGVQLNWLTTQEPILRTWHFDFPPNEAEENRNDAIYGVQNNRNPYIDYPQFVDRIDRFSSIEFDEMADYFLTNEVIDFGYIDTQGEFTFMFPIYNNGETELSFTDFHFEGAEDISINIPEDSVITIQPGEDFSLLLNYNSDDEDGDWGQLEFNQVGESETVEIPVFANIEVGVTTAKLAESITLYPNPARNILNIMVAEEFTTKKDVRIYNTSGQSIFEQLSISGSEQQLSLDQFKNGIYWLQINCLGQSVIKPFVIQK